MTVNWWCGAVVLMNWWGGGVVGGDYCILDAGWTVSRTQPRRRLRLLHCELSPLSLLTVVIVLEVYSCVCLWPSYCLGFRIYICLWRCFHPNECAILEFLKMLLVCC
jgi:hypothetical protein